MGISATNFANFHEKEKKNSRQFVKFAAGCLQLLSMGRLPAEEKEKKVMLAAYIDQAMEQAVYGIIEGEGAYWGEIRGLQGVWACRETLEDCRRELREALSDWLALRLRLGLPIPVLANIDLSKIAQPV